MSLVRWNIEAQMVEVWDEDEHFLLHPYLEVVDFWENAKRILEERGYSLPTFGQMYAIHKSRKDIDEIIVNHFGSQLKGDFWHWTRTPPKDYVYPAVYLHNKLCRHMRDPGRYIGRAVLDLNK